MSGFNDLENYQIFSAAKELAASMSDRIRSFHGKAELIPNLIKEKLIVEGSRQWQGRQVSFWQWTEAGRAHIKAVSMITNFEDLHRLINEYQEKINSNGRIIV